MPPARSKKCKSAIWRLVAPLVATRGVEHGSCRSQESGYILAGNRSADVIEETIKQIEARIQSTDSLTPERRRELIELLATLKAEAGELAKTHGDAGAKHRRLRPGHHP